MDRDNCSDKICLDYACGNGEYAFKMLNANSKLVWEWILVIEKIVNLAENDKKNDAIFFGEL